jgi:signal transduction histidine kinase
MDQKHTRTLIVEDNPGDAFLVQEQLSDGDVPFEIEAAEDLAAAMKAVAKKTPDVVLLDLNLPDSRGTETIRKMVRKLPNVPVLVLTGQDDEELAIRAVQEGAQDYLFKSELDKGHLVRAIKYAIERQSLLLALQKSRDQQLHFKDQLLSHVSHELRSPLTCIHQFVTILLDGLSGPLTPEQRECLETVLKSSNQLRTMINDLLETAVIEAGKLKLELQCVPLNDLVNQAGDMLHATADAKGIILEWSAPSEPLLVYADPHRVLQVLLNLIENAVKFTPKGGTIQLTAEKSDDSSSALVQVRDTGCGISESAQPLVFEKLFQEENASDQARKGLGLGLSICKDLVLRQGGNIWVKSHLGRGSTFSFTLPTFSLSKLLFPVLVENGRVRESVCLMTIKLAPVPVTSALEAWGKTRREFLDLLQRCILPDKDVLLPPMRRSDTGEIFFMIAATDAPGAEVLAKRIRDQVARRAEISSNSVLSVSSELLRNLSQAQSSSAEEWVEEIAKVVVNATTKALSQGGNL